jgi:hypothetical protein
MDQSASDKIGLPEAATPIWQRFCNIIHETDPQYQGILLNLQLLRSESYSATSISEWHFGFLMKQSGPGVTFIFETAASDKHPDVISRSWFQNKGKKISRMTVAK